MFLPTLGQIRQRPLQVPKEAQAELAEKSQEEVDRIVKSIADAGVRNAARLAVMANEDTGFGIVELSNRQVFLPTLGQIRQRPLQVPPCSLLLPLPFLPFYHRKFLHKGIVSLTVTGDVAAVQAAMDAAAAAAEQVGQVLLPPCGNIHSI